MLSNKSDWNYMDQNKNVTFANLSPGEYTFKVKSTNSSGLWQDNEQSLQIIITPPFWAWDGLNDSIPLMVPI